MYQSTRNVYFRFGYGDNPPTNEEIKSHFTNVLKAQTIFGVPISDKSIMRRDRLKKHLQMRWQQIRTNHGEWVKDCRSWAWHPWTDDPFEDAGL